MPRSLLDCRRWRNLLAAIVSLGLGLTAARPALTQEAEQEITPAQRSAQFEALAREVQGFERQGNILKQVVKLVAPTVVHINAERIDQTLLRYGRKRQIEEAGSGMVIQANDRFFVLTNRHVIRGAEAANINIKFADGRELQPVKIWSDPETDIAVLSVDAKDLVPAKLGDSDSVEIGDFVLAVGSPFGLSHSVTYGIISAKGRRDLELGDESVRLQDFLQTDAAINPGNSGGPLLNIRGEVIGVNTAIASSSGGSEGIGFSIPINMVMGVARQLIERGNVVRAYLGVQLDRKFSAVQATKLGLPRQRGARITAITAKSPAEVAQLQVDDVVLEYNGVHIEDDNHLVNMVSLTEVGREVPLLVYRNRQLVTIMVRVSDRATFEPAKK